MTFSGTSGITYPSGTLEGDASIGYGQTWQNVLSSRTYNTTYTNTTGKPIMVAVCTGNNGQTGNPSMSLVVGGITTGGQSQDSSSYAISSQSAIVPNGVTYRLTTGNGSMSLNYWAELR